MAKKTKTAKSAAAKKTATTSVAKQTKGTVVLKTICADLGIDPKTARRVLRKRMRSDVPAIAKFHAIKTRWVQGAQAAQVIRSTLKEYLAAAA